MPKVAKDPEAPNEEGRRLDGRNLIDDWVRDKKKRGLRAEYVWNKGQLEKINPNEVDYLLGKSGKMFLTAGLLNSHGSRTWKLSFSTSTRTCVFKLRSN